MTQSSGHIVYLACTVRQKLEQARNHRAVDSDANRAELAAIQPGYETALDQAKDEELFGHARAIALVDGFLRPDNRVQVPDWAVIGRDCRDAAKRVERSAFASALLKP